MADVIKMTDGTTSVDLYYDTDGFEMLSGGNDFGTAKHKNLYHESAALDGAMLVRHSKENRPWSFKLAVRGANNTAIATTLGIFNRLVDQARRYQLSSSGQKVYLEIQLDGASQATYYDVIDVDYSKAAFFNYYNLRQKELIFGDGLSLTVLTKPLGYGAEETLRNFLANPGFMQRIAAGAGESDSWNVSGAPTVTTEYSISLIGSSAQKIVTDTSGTDGIYSDVIACTDYQGQAFAGYVWVYRSSGNNITLDVVGDDSGSLETATYNAATETETGLDGTSVFRKLSVSGTIGAADTEITIRIERLTGDASAATTYYVDKCYFGMGVTSTPTAWASCERVNNYRDEDAWPYIDIADIQGDSPAEIEIDIDPTTTTAAQYIHMALADMLYEDKNGAVNRTPYLDMYWYELSANADVGRTRDASTRLAANTSWGSVAGAGAIGTYGRLVGNYVLMAAIKSSTAVGARMRVLLNGAYSDEKDISLTTDYQLFVSPPISYKDISNIVYMHSGAYYLQIALDTGTANVDTDFIMLVPIDNSYVVMNPGTMSGYARLQRDGRAIVATPFLGLSYTSAYTSSAGGSLSIKPHSDQRILFMFYNAASHSLESANTIIRYRPQTEFLLP